MGETVVLFQVFSTLALCSQKIKLTVKPLSHMTITTTSPKSKKYQRYHNLLGFTFTMVGQQSMVVTTEKLREIVRFHLGGVVSNFYFQF